MFGNILIRIEKELSLNKLSSFLFTEPNATIYVYKNTKKLKTLKASSKGTARGTIQTYKKGSEILIYVKDKAGNKSKVKKVKVQ